MGLFSFLKSKFSKKKDESTETYVQGMSKSRAAFASRLDDLSKRYASVNQQYFEELEQILIESDVGVDLSLRLIEKLLDASKEQKISEPSKINEMLIDEMFVSYATAGAVIKNEIQFVSEGPTVLLVVGVNGVGKTTSIAKLAYRYQKQGKSVLLVAADTFRAGAVEQLQSLGRPAALPDRDWPSPMATPRAFAYDGAKYAKEHQIDLMIVDTAGRLQNKSNLMAELSKMKRVLSREIPNAPHETFLIIDATTGQNGVEQAKPSKTFQPLTGIVITKMDGTSKGGIILSIRDELGVPVRFIGLGEKMDDLQSSTSINIFMACY
jgi:fused signal recognition particle receptor